ncbi:MAG: phosphatase [Clostridiales bacterium]|nr:phosphatase [Eubacteriales bacterium]MDH7567296.1 phosphatase [Clostridiales bacterium]
MKILVDTHTHTVASGHAYSTVQEMAKEASNKGIEAFIVTDHGPLMKGAPCLYHFTNLKVLPEKLHGVKIFKGVEANISDYTGSIDMPEDILRKLDFVLAALHDVCIEPSSLEEHTEALVNAIKNPCVDAIAHPGNPRFQVDIEKVVKAAKEYNKVIEINSHSFSARPGSEKNCREFAVKCKEMGVPVVCSSDAHISFDVGRVDAAVKLLAQCNVPEELVINTSLEKFEKYLNSKNEKKYNF